MGQSDSYSPGGLGESVLSSVEAKMIRRAIGEGWDVSEEAMKKVLASLMKTCEDSEDDRAKCAAGGAIINICKLNLSARQWLEELTAKKLGAASSSADPERMTDAELDGIVKEGLK